MVKCRINAYDWFGNLDVKSDVISTSKVRSGVCKKLCIRRPEDQKYYVVGRHIGNYGRPHGVLRS